MIELIFQLLLIPAFLPGMADQSREVQTRLEGVHQRLMDIDRDLARYSQDPANLVSVSLTPNNPLAEGERLRLPRVTGRVLGEGLTPEAKLGAEPSNPDSTLQAPSNELALRGVLNAGNGRVAIVSQGENEYVVGSGSYLLNKYRVREIGPSHIQLRALTGKGSDLRLTLNHASGDSTSPNNSFDR